jgi:hypothetical protein
MCKQVWSQQWQGEMAPSFLSSVWHGEAFHGLGVQDVTEFDSDGCSVFCLMEQGEEKERKKRERNDPGGAGSGGSWVQTHLLAVPWVAAIRCN